MHTVELTLVSTGADAELQSSAADQIDERRLAGKVDQLIVGGGIANTFIAAAGHAVGESLYEPDLIDEAKKSYVQLGVS